MALIQTGPSPSGSSLWEPLDRRVTRHDLLHVWDGTRFVEWSWEEWLQRSLRFAAALRARDIRPGDRVACLLTTTPTACAAVLGVWFAGACLVSLPLISRGMALAEYVAMLRRIIGTSEPELLLCERGFTEQLRAAGLSAPVAAFEEMNASVPHDPTPPADDEVAFVQFSSGSTSEPRGCMLTPRAIAWQLQSLAQALAIEPDRDTGVVWLPLAHDMGLFGCLLLTYWTGHRLFLSSPQRFLGDPSSWLADCARFGATISATPSFGLEMAVRVAEVRLPPPIPMRRLVIGGERVEASTLERAHSVLGDARLKRSALVPAYGLAEAVLAVTMSTIDRAPTILQVDASALAAGRVQECEGTNGSPLLLVSAGRPLVGASTRIAGDVDIGEIVVRSGSLAEGYLNAPELTGSRFSDDELYTGDLGFVRGGVLFVRGRLDDLMCVAGRNIYARDIEAAITEIPGVRPGACAVVDIERGAGTELVAIVELREPRPDAAIIARHVKARTRAVAGIHLHDCLFVPRGRLPKTPSGKLQRWRCRELALRS